MSQYSDTLRFINMGLVVILLGPVMIACHDASIAPFPEIPEIKVVSLEVKHCVDTGKSIKGVYARNMSSFMGETEWKSDFDRDGLSDEIEFPKSTVNLYNISYRSADTNGDGYSDFLVMKLGQSIGAQAMLRTCDDPGVDTDSDGLTNCEESIIKTDYQKPDSDGDGLTDLLELLVGLNPRDPADAFQDMDQDGYSNFSEIQMNTPIDISNTKPMDKMSLVYEAEYFSDEQNRNCARYRVEKIPVMGTTNGNLVKFWVVEADSSDLLTTKYVAVLFPETIEAKTRILVEQANDQTIDGVKEPLVTEPGE